MHAASAVTRRHDRPLISDYLGDPFVFTSGGTYYVLGTGAGEARGEVAASADATVFPLYAARDLESWKPLGHALIRPDAALGTTFWAPEVAERDGTFYLYYSAGFDDKNHRLRVATSPDPAGPYRDAGVDLSWPAYRFAIDPHPFRDVDGRWFLFFACDFLNDVDEHGKPARPGTALVVHELESMLRLAPGGHTVLRAHFEWQRFLADRPMYGGRYDWHTLEGPAVLRRDERYYCFYSGGRWETESYGVDYAVAEHVLGPYDDSGGALGPRVLASVPGHLLGPGHNSFVQATDGSGTLVCYHAWDAQLTARRLHVTELVWTAEGPRARGFGAGT